MTRIGRKTNLMDPLSRQRARALEELASERPGAQGVHLYLLALSSWLSSLLFLSLAQLGRSWLRSRQSEDKVTATWAAACSSSGSSAQGLKPAAWAQWEAG